jgi:S1-C subfamily serine protease
VVDIMTSLGYQQANAAGTGIVLTSSGFVLTNNHVVQGATTIRVQVGDSGPRYSATVVGTDKTDDVAVIKVSGAPSLATAKLGTASSLAVGDSVTAVGNALGQGQLSVVTGTVQALDQQITASDAGGANAEQLSGLIQTNAPLQPGDSGGPLLNANNQVIGMDTAASSGFRFQSASDVAFAIPIDKALTVAHQIEAGRSSNTVQIGLPAFLGVSSIDVSEAAASGRFSPPVSSGAVVSGVASGTPAATAGLVSGDAIVSLDGTEVTGASQLGTLIQAHRAGDSVKISYVDANGGSHTVTVALIAGPAA